jgi:hypothetical protein
MTGPVADVLVDVHSHGANVGWIAGGDKENGQRFTSA